MRRPLRSLVTIAVVVFVLGVVAHSEPLSAEAGVVRGGSDPDVGLPPFGTPANVSLTTVGVDTVTVSWEGVADTAGYLIHRDRQYLAYVSAGTEFVDETVVEGERYQYQVRAQDDRGNRSPPTPTASITVGGADTEAPSVPDAVVVSGDGVGRVTLSWNASTDNVGVTGYLIHRDRQYLAYVSAGTEFVDETVVEGERYRYQVRARDGAGNDSAPTDVLAAAVP